MFGKIKFKQVGNFLTMILGGTIKTVQGSERIDKLKELTNEYNENPTPELLQEMEGLLNSEKTRKLEEIKKQEEELKQSEIDEQQRLKQLEESQSQAMLKSKARKDVIDNLDQFELADDRFVKTKKDGRTVFYLKGFETVVIPEPLLVDIKEAIDKQKPIESLINFWMFNLLLEDNQARNDLYKYLMRNGIKLTKEGYFVTVRRVNKKRKIKKEAGKVLEIDSRIAGLTEDQLNQFIYKAKGWSHSPKQYTIIKNEDGSFKMTRYKKYLESLSTGEQPLPHLGDMLNMLTPPTDSETGEVQVYTDAHTGKFDITIGNPVRMARNLCDNDPNNDCSNGLHVGTPDFASKGGFGQDIIICLVNPMHTISVPYRDAHKMRVCEYLPVKVAKDMKEVYSVINGDLSEYVHQYKLLEVTELEKDLKLIQAKYSEKPQEFDFEGARKELLTDMESLTKLDLGKIDEIQKRLEAIKLSQTEVKGKRESVHLLNDSYNPDVDIEQLKLIISSRIKNVA